MESGFNDSLTPASLSSRARAHFMRMSAASSSSSSSSSPEDAAAGRRGGADGRDEREEEQRILSAERGEGRIRLRMTPAAAEFVLGPNAASVTQIEHLSKVEAVYSFVDGDGSQPPRPIRVFEIVGSCRDSLQRALDMFCHAVQLYKDLTEGMHEHSMVTRLHVLDGVLYRYEPPLKSRVPSAAKVRREQCEVDLIERRPRPEDFNAMLRGVRQKMLIRDQNLMWQRLPWTDERRAQHHPNVTAANVWEARAVVGYPEITNHDSSAVQNDAGREGPGPSVEPVQRQSAEASPQSHRETLQAGEESPGDSGSGEGDS